MVNIVYALGLKYLAHVSCCLVIYYIFFDLCTGFECIKKNNPINGMSDSKCATNIQTIKGRKSFKDSWQNISGISTNSATFLKLLYVSLHYPYTYVIQVLVFTQKSTDNQRILEKRKGKVLLIKCLIQENWDAFILKIGMRVQKFHLKFILDSFKTKKLFLLKILNLIHLVIKEASA